MSSSDGSLQPLKMFKKTPRIVNDILIDNVDEEFRPQDIPGGSLVEYYFDIEVDKEIDQEVLCQVVEKLEINNQFLDEELICPDQRTDRFDIYATRVGPEDLEDCD